MSLWKIAWRSIQQRALASGLTAISMALGVALVVAVLVVHSVVYQSFHRGGEGYDLIVGANKGSGLDLVLSSVYYVSRPVENIPYSFYKKLREGDLSSHVLVAVPICLGDVCDGFPVVGTTPEMFDELTYLDDQPYRFAEGGRNFDRKNFFEAVIGSTVAKRLGLKVGDSFRPSHDTVGKKKHEHDPFTIVGILEPTGTPNDRALFINIEGFYRVGQHAGQLDVDEDATQSEEGHAAASSTAAAEARHDHDHEEIAEDMKRVSAVLVRTDEERRPNACRMLAREINQGTVAQAVIPSVEISLLFQNVIGNIERVLLVFSIAIVLVAGIGIMVSIYNSMSDRRHEIAIMRALGASRATVMSVILMESILLSLGGGLLGLSVGHGIIAALGPAIAEQTGVAIGLLQFRAVELILIPGLLALASIVGYLPAVAAYRTDVARSLTANP